MKNKFHFLLYTCVFLHSLYRGNIASSLSNTNSEINASLKKHVSSESKAKDALSQALREKRHGIHALEAELDLLDSDDDGLFGADPDLAVEEEELPAHQRVLSLLKADRPFAVQCMALLCFTLHLGLFIVVPQLIPIPKELSGPQLEERVAEEITVRVLLARRALFSVLVHEGVGLAVKGRRLAVALRSQPWDKARKAIRNLSLDPTAQYLYYSAIFLVFATGASKPTLGLLGICLVPLAVRELAFGVAALARLAATVHPGLKDWYYKVGYLWFGPKYEQMTPKERSIKIGKTIGQITFLSEVWVTIKILRNCLLSTPPNVVLLVSYLNFMRAKCFLSPKMQEAILDMLKPAGQIVLALFSKPTKGGVNLQKQEDSSDLEKCSSHLSEPTSAMTDDQGEYSDSDENSDSYSEDSQSDESEIE
mmetsp:Transcript_5855/g.8038  ORF Transcript_5855/g.8038 Transcript_5855/m.8038 type:complete len:422 (+) Transcript_5855:107-1372(+)|eukprot:CAMPEP_0117746344 /NCGR_PEP_ID=MMETSP0947-20121206/7891_1 /TAXON_ID=44440 /ORGANISM="Chattonella subsalsa, Strain CCMP2191" /LENGTH=421 /DNA_ID=CAMNT_0005563651 /DNA_START=79 /DNA_END=1344 /DNA_ORIENTATION=-